MGYFFKEEKGDITIEILLGFATVLVLKACGDEINLMLYLVNSVQVAENFEGNLLTELWLWKHKKFSEHVGSISD